MRTAIATGAAFLVGVLLALGGWRLFYSWGPWVAAERYAANDPELLALFGPDLRIRPWDFEAEAHGELGFGPRDGSVRGASMSLAVDIRGSLRGADARFDVLEKDAAWRVVDVVVVFDDGTSYRVARSPKCEALASGVTAFDIQLRNGVVHTLNGQHELAFEALTCARLIERDSAEVLFWLGTLYADRGQEADALEYLHAAQVRRPDRIAVVRMLDAIHSFKKRWPAVVDEWTQYLNRFPAHPSGFLARARAEHELGDELAAEADLVRACDGGFVEACADFQLRPPPEAGEVRNGRQAMTH